MNRVSIGSLTATEATSVQTGGIKHIAGSLEGAAQRNLDLAQTILDALDGCSPGENPAQLNSVSGIAETLRRSLDKNYSLFEILSAISRTIGLGQ